MLLTPIKPILLQGNVSHATWLLAYVEYSFFLEQVSRLTFVRVDRCFIGLSRYLGDIRQCLREEVDLWT
jgi:hypothetical protein